MSSMGDGIEAVAGDEVGGGEDPLFAGRVAGTDHSGGVGRLSSWAGHAVETTVGAAPDGGAQLCCEAVGHRQYPGCAA